MSEDQKQKLWDICTSFVSDQKISCAEAVYQTDRVIVNAYEFIEKVCDTVGYHTEPPEVTEGVA